MGGIRTNKNMLICSGIIPKYNKTGVDVKVVRPERTFWEKITILHQEANRPNTKNIPHRYSRHYYGVYQIIHSQYYGNAIKEIQLLEKVVNFKKGFYPNNSAKYEEAMQGNLKLVPDEYRFTELKNDYSAMEEMLFGNIPKFEDILLKLKEVEDYINELCKEQCKIPAIA